MEAVSRCIVEFTPASQKLLDDFRPLNAPSYIRNIRAYVHWRECLSLRYYTSLSSRYVATWRDGREDPGGRVLLFEFKASTTTYSLRTLGIPNQTPRASAEERYPKSTRVKSCRSYWAMAVSTTARIST